jgi:hypothetical protein
MRLDDVGERDDTRSGEFGEELPDPVSASATADKSYFDRRVRLRAEYGLRFEQEHSAGCRLQKIPPLVHTASFEKSPSYRVKKACGAFGSGEGVWIREILEFVSGATQKRGYRDKILWGAWRIMLEGTNAAVAACPQEAGGKIMNCGAFLLDRISTPGV